MTNIDLRFSGYANFKSVEAQTKALQGRFAALNKKKKKTAYDGGIVDPKRFANAQRMAKQMQSTYSDAIASSGEFEVSQRKVQSHTQGIVKGLQQQKLGVRALTKDVGGLKRAYEEQLRMQRMSVTSFSTDSQGNPLATIAVPKGVPRDLDTINNRLGFMAHAAQSAGTQMVNWGKNTQWSGRQLAQGFTLPLMAFAAVSGKVAYDVDANLTRIAKVYDTTSTSIGTASQKAIAKETELNQLRSDGLNTSRNLAQKYGAAVNDTLDVQGQLAATGMNGNKLQAQTVEVQRLAILGEMDYRHAVDSSIAIQSTDGYRTP